MIEKKSLQSEYIKWAIQQKIKNNYTCQICGIKNERNQDKNPIKKIVCHHITPISVFGFKNINLLMDEKNILIVCEFCHQTICHKRSFTIAAFNNYFSGEHGRGNILNKLQNQGKDRLSNLIKRYQ